MRIIAILALTFVASVSANQDGSEFTSFKYQTREHIKTRTLIEECVAHCRVSEPYEYAYKMKPDKCMDDSSAWRRGFRVIPDTYYRGLCPGEGRAVVSLKKITKNRFGEQREVFSSCTFGGDEYQINELTECGK